MRIRFARMASAALVLLAGGMLGGCMTLVPVMAPKVEAEKNIGVSFDFEPHYVTVQGSRMHFVETGKGAPVVFVHGNPTSSYLWRNVLPIVGRDHRAIAVDLIGMGKSDKPDIDYSLDDHIRYFEGLMEKLDLKNVILVLHDWGGPIGVDYAMRHPGRVKGIVLMETIVRPMQWDEMNMGERYMFRKFRNAGEGDELIVKENYFVEKLLPMMAGRDMTPQEMDQYRAPFASESSRRPIVRFPREIPIDGLPVGNANRLAQNYEMLQRSTIPLLLLSAKPGAIVKEAMVASLREGLPRLEVEDIGAGIHFLQETQPKRIGESIQKWVERLP